MENFLLRGLRHLGIEIIDGEDAVTGSLFIPLREARLCVNCEHIIRTRTCPLCGSKHNLHLGIILGENRGKNNQPGHKSVPQIERSGSARSDHSLR